MSKLGKLFQGIGALIKTPSLINQVTEHESRYRNQVVQQYGFKDGLPVVEFSDLCSDESSLDHYLFLDGGSLITDLLLLKNLAISTDDCIYFEIGTWRGESVINVVDQTTQCYSFNLSQDQLKEMGYDSQYLSQLERLSKNHPKITHIKGDSQSFDFEALDFKPNLVFIDGDHRTEAVERDTKKIFDWIDPDNCTIVWHDYGTSPEKVRWSVLKGILDGCPKKYRNNLYHVSHTKCAIYTTQKLASRSLLSPETVTSSFRIETSKRPVK